MKAALVGLGGQGRRLAQAVRSMPGVDLVAVVDHREEALAWGELPDATRRLRSAEELWQGGGADLVCVATNGPSHSVLAIEAMRAGARYVLVEKPMACSVAECAQMGLEAERQGARLAVNHSRRHDPLYRWLRAEIRSGRWGEPRMVHVQRPGIGLGCLGTHSFDLARFLTDRDVSSVTGWIDVPVGLNPRGAPYSDPGGLVVMQMGRQLRAVVAQLEDGAGPMSVEIDLTGARIRVDERSGEIEILERDFSVAKAPDRPAHYRAAEAPPGMTAKTDMVAMSRALLDELVADGDMECASIHGRRAIEVLVAAYVSHREGNLPVNPATLHAQDKQLCLPVT